MKKATNSRAQHFIAKIREGDTSAFRHLIDDYKAMSFSLACSILKDHTLAEDALQEAFIKVFRQLSRYKGTASFSTWLYRIVVNTCFTIAKKEALHPTTDGGVPHNETEGSFDIEVAEQRQIVNRALDRLKAEEALTLRLYYLSELSIKEIVAITKFSESKIKVTLHRGRQHLKTTLETVLGKEATALI